MHEYIACGQVNTERTEVIECDQEHCCTEQSIQSEFQFLITHQFNYIYYIVYLQRNSMQGAQRYHLSKNSVYIKMN